MRIYGTGNSSPSATRKSDKKSDKGKASSFASAVNQPETGVSGPVQVASTGVVASVDALLSLQEAPDGAGARSKGLSRAHDMLSLLDDVRKGLLLGAIPRSRLERLAELVNRGKTGFEDPVLKDILSDIELRAAVELAKLDHQE